MKKTNKSVAKRIKVTGKKKLLKRPCQQNHFQSKITGRKKQDQSRLSGFSKKDIKAIEKYLPHR